MVRIDNTGAQVVQDRK